MRIEKQYHFYAAHRNKALGGKCARLHGHRYGLTCVFGVPRHSYKPFDCSAVTLPFEEIDSKIEPMLKEFFDHRTFIDQNDGVLNRLIKDHPDWLIELPFPSSAENVAFFLFYCIHAQLNLPLIQLRLQETDSATIVYDLADYREEVESFDDNWFAFHPTWQMLG